MWYHRKQGHQQTVTSNLTTKMGGFNNEIKVYLVKKPTQISDVPVVHYNIGFSMFPFSRFDITAFDVNIFPPLLRLVSQQTLSFLVNVLYVTKNRG